MNHLRVYVYVCVCVMILMHGVIFTCIRMCRLLISNILCMFFNINQLSDLGATLKSKLKVTGELLICASTPVDCMTQ